MISRLLVVVAVVAAAGVVWSLWKRAPRGIRRLDLADIGVAGPAIIQFGTPYCSPCKRYAPALEATAREASVGFAQVDLAERPELAGRYGIRTVPTIVVARPDGEVVGTWTSLPANGEIVHAAVVASGASTS